MPPDATDKLEAVHMRHSQIGDDDIRYFSIQPYQCVVRRTRRGHPGARRLEEV